jgi:hypothetical protein
MEADSTPSGPRRGSQVAPVVIPAHPQDLPAGRARSADRARPDAGHRAATAQRDVTADEVTNRITNQPGRRGSARCSG